MSRQEGGRVEEKRRSAGELPEEVERLGYARRYLITPEGRALVEAFVDFFQREDRNARILELGCGDGFWLETLRNLGFRRLIGIDRSLPLLELAAEKGLDVRCGDLYDLDVRNVFDIVLFCDTLEHLPDPEGALLRAHRALKTHGTLFVLAPVYESFRCRWQRVVLRRSRWEQAQEDDPSHLQAFSSSRLIELLEAAHFSPEHLAYVANWWPGGRLVSVPRGRWGQVGGACCD
ncbi:MAG: hypothetical protein KatS3mg115_2605 [Candidatus Poribacteria bacterium]|nr:MAG: hypothetical protein KatS3mg115_2605 [Candidatus Poribacteria bacterium]